ncbi:MAG: hypothetical protein HDQ95_09570 [Roseburia sp.]|nr:hypothetical protein [Roseburia sp.]
MDERERLINERDQKMTEASIELMKLRMIQDRPYWSTISYREEFKTKDEWLYIWTGKKRDIFIFIFMMTVLPYLVYCMLYTADEDTQFIPWVYLLMDIAVVVVWIYQAVKTKNLPVRGENDVAEQRAICGQKVKELNEIEAKLKKLELQEQQEEQAMSEDRKEPTEEEDQEDQED